MVYIVNINYEESYAIRVEADSPQEAQALIDKQLDSESLEAHPDRSTLSREWYIDVEA